MAGDFNCVISQADCTGKPNMSRALEKITKGIRLYDVCEKHPHTTAYTHYTNFGASRIDRIYITEALINQKQAVETVAAAFSDHFAVTLRLKLDGTRMMQKDRVWRKNITLLEESTFQETIKEQWKKWQKYLRYYPNKVEWCDRYVKKQMKQLFQREGAERSSDRRELENQYYGMIYRVIREPISQDVKAIQLRKLKAKITRLHSIQKRGALLDMEDKDRIPGEHISLHQYLKSRKRRTIHRITYVIAENGLQQTGRKEIMNTFTEHKTRRYNNIKTEERKIKELITCGINKIPKIANEAIEEEITMDELKTAIKKGKEHKSPGQDGICHEFYKIMWETIKQEVVDVINHMYKYGTETDKQKSGIIVCLPNNSMPTKETRSGNP